MKRETTVSFHKYISAPSTIDYTRSSQFFSLGRLTLSHLNLSEELHFYEELYYDQTPIQDNLKNLDLTRARLLNQGEYKKIYEIKTPEGVELVFFRSDIKLRLPRYMSALYLAAGSDSNSERSESIDRDSSDSIRFASFTTQDLGEILFDETLTGFVGAFSRISPSDNKQEWLYFFKKMLPFDQVFFNHQAYTQSIPLFNDFVVGVLKETVNLITNFYPRAFLDPKPDNMGLLRNSQNQTEILKKT